MLARFWNKSLCSHQNTGLETIFGKAFFTVDQSSFIRSGGFFDFQQVFQLNEQENSLLDRKQKSLYFYYSMSNSARGQDLRNALKNFISVTQILTSDMLEAHKSLDKEKSNQFWARIFIRAFAAYIEGAIHGLKQTALQVAAITQVELKAAFCAILKDEGYDINDKGEPRVSKKFYRFENNLKFAFHAFAHVHASEFKPDYNHDGYAALKRSMTVRDGLMHPKTIFGLEVTKEHILDVVRASKWMDKQFDDLLADCDPENTMKRVNRNK